MNTFTSDFLSLTKSLDVSESAWKTTDAKSNIVIIEFSLAKRLHELYAGSILQGFWRLFTATII